MWQLIFCDFGCSLFFAGNMFMDTNSFKCLCVFVNKSVLSFLWFVHLWGFGLDCHVIVSFSYFLYFPFFSSFPVSPCVTFLSHYLSLLLPNHLYLLLITFSSYLDVSHFAFFVCHAACGFVTVAFTC